MSLREALATKQSRQKQSTRLNRSIILTITTTLSLITLILGGLLLLPNTLAKAEQSTTEQDTDINLSIAEVVGLSINNCPGLPDSDSSSITLTPSPTINGTFASNCQTITAYANTPGYSLLMKHDNNTPPSVIISDPYPVEDPAGYDFTTTEGNMQYISDLYGIDLSTGELTKPVIASFPTGANCFVPSVIISGDINTPLNEMQGWPCYGETIDPDSGPSAPCLMTDTNGTCEGYDANTDTLTGETLCYVQAALPHWCTDNPDGTSGNMIVRYDPDLVYQNPTTIDPKPVIPSTTGTLTTPTTLTNNTWGFAIEQKTGMTNTNFDTTYTANNANNNYAQMPTSDTEIYHTDNLTTGDTFEAFYGTKVNMDTLAGIYSTTITYTVIGEDVPPAPLKFREISAGDSYTCAIASDNNAYCWGQDSDGSLGEGYGWKDSNIPVKVDSTGVLSGLTIKQISAGDEHACVIASDDNAYCWGGNNYGGLGNGLSGVMNYSDAPVKVDTSGVLSGLTIKKISAGRNHTCAIASDDNAYCWGGMYNNHGILGSGSNANSNVPVKVDNSGVLNGLSIKQISTGWNNSCVIASDDNAYCWGYKPGNGANISSNVPVKVDNTGVLNGLTIKQISVSIVSSCAIASDDNVYCWGENNHGQLGNGPNADSNVPVKVDNSGVLNGLSIKQIFSDYDGLYVIASDDNAYCWGSKPSSGANISSNVPVKVDISGLPNGLTIRQISAGISHACAIASDDNAYCWADNYYGQLGNGTNTDSNVLVKVINPTR